MLSIAVAGLSIVAPPNITKVWEANEGDSRDALQDLSKYTTADYCEGRSVGCNVLVDVPEACAGAEVSSCAIALCLHGNDGTSSQGADICGKEIHARGEYIGVYPQADPVEPGKNNGQWNDGQVHYNEKGPTLLTCKFDDYGCKSDPDDGKFLSDVYHAVKNAGVTGPLVVMGESRGSIMAHRAAASSSAALPVVAFSVHAAGMQGPVRAGPGTLNYNQPTAATKPVAYMVVVPMDDKYANPEGGAKFQSETFTWVPITEASSMWAVHNGCANQTTTSFSTWKLIQGSGAAKHHKVNALTEPGEPSVSKMTGTAGKITEVTYTGCPASAPVTYYLADKGTHEMMKQIGTKMWMTLGFDMFDKVIKAH